MRQLHIFLLLAALLGSLAAAAVTAAEPLGIIAIDARSGVVTVRNADTGRTYQVKVSDRVALSALKVGQTVTAEISADKVTLRPAEPVGIRGKQITAISGTIVGQSGELQSSGQPVMSAGGLGTGLRT